MWHPPRFQWQAQGFIAKFFEKFYGLPPVYELLRDLPPQRAHLPHGAEFFEIFPPPNASKLTTFVSFPVPAMPPPIVPPFPDIFASISNFLNKYFQTMMMTIVHPRGPTSSDFVPPHSLLFIGSGRLDPADVHHPPPSADDRDHRSSSPPPPWSIIHLHFRLFALLWTGPIAIGPLSVNISLRFNPLKF